MLDIRSKQQSCTWQHLQTGKSIIRGTRRGEQRWSREEAEQIQREGRSREETWGTEIGAGVGKKSYLVQR